MIFKNIFIGFYYIIQIWFYLFVYCLTDVKVESVSTKRQRLKRSYLTEMAILLPVGEELLLFD